MFLFFKTPAEVKDGDYELRLSHEKGDTILWSGNATLQDAVFWDNIRVTENESVGDRANIRDFYITESGRKVVTEYFNDYETMAAGLYPFVMGSAWGVEDNRAHLSELHAPYTQAGWDVKRLDDVITNSKHPYAPKDGGEWSVKVNGTPTAGRTVMQTIPQLFRFEPGVTYDVSFDYQMGSGDTFRFVVGNGNMYAPSSTTGAMSSITTTVATGNRIALFGESIDGVTTRFSHRVTGANTGQTWVGIVRHGNAASQASNFVGRADFVLDNIHIIVAVPAESVQLDKDTMDVFVGDRYDLVETVMPENATNKLVVWSSSNTSVATVDRDGRVTAVRPGTATIRATTRDGGFIATSEVTVWAIPDRDDLDAAIAQFDGLEVRRVTAYLVGAWEAAEEAAEFAKAVNADTNAKQHDVDEAFITLRTALNNLVRASSAGLRGPDYFSYVEEPLEYYVWLDTYAKAVNAIEVRVTVNNNLDFEGVDIKILEAFATLGFEIISMDWDDNDEDAIRGRLTLGFKTGNMKTEDLDGIADILKLTFEAIIPGAGDSEIAEVTLNSVILVSHEGNVAKQVVAYIAEEDATRKSFVYSKYDLNKDGEVDVVDLGVALLATGWNANDVGWNEYTVSWDVRGRAITPAMIDVNRDGQVNMLDILDIVSNYTGW